MGPIKPERIFNEEVTLFLFLFLDGFLVISVLFGFLFFFYFRGG